MCLKMRELKSIVEMLRRENRLNEDRGEEDHCRTILRLKEATKVFQKHYQKHYLLTINTVTFEAVLPLYDSRRFEAFNWCYRKWKVR